MAKSVNEEFLKPGQVDHLKKLINELHENLNDRPVRTSVITHDIELMSRQKHTEYRLGNEK